MFEIDRRIRHLRARPSKEPVRARPALPGEHHSDVAIGGGGRTIVVEATREIGELDHVMARWPFESLDDRQVRRTRILAGPRWQAHLVLANGLQQRRTARILSPVSFSPLH